MNRPYKTVKGIGDGVPIFPGSRLPVYFLVDYIDSDTSLDVFEESCDIDMAHVEALLLSPLPQSLRHDRNLV